MLGKTGHHHRNSRCWKVAFPGKKLPELLGITQLRHFIFGVQTIVIFRTFRMQGYVQVASLEKLINQDVTA